jgi:hypothetical protein
MGFNLSKIPSYSLNYRSILLHNKEQPDREGFEPHDLTIAVLFFLAAPGQIPSLWGVMLFKTFIVGEGDLI